LYKMLDRVSYPKEPRDMDDQALISFGLWIKRRRKALDLTQDALAALVGCSKDLIVKIEGDARRPSREIAALLATQLQLAPEERDDFIRCARAELAPDRLPPPSRSVPRAAFPARPSADHPRSNLPAPISSFLGREKELADLWALLARADVRLVTLTGPGGTGKTRLGLQSAADLLDHFPDGAFLVDLAPITDPELVATTVAQILGVTDAGNQPIRERLKSALRTKDLLLVLDNFEQVLDAAPLVAELLAAAADLKVLITSRVLLRLSGEHEYAVPPLALPPTTDDRRPPTDHARGVVVGGQWSVVGQYAAVALFIARAQAAKADFALTDESAPAVAEICHRLDGLPLAIELAAVRVKLFPPEALLVRLERDGVLGLLTGGARDLPARQQTIRSTINWSYELLSADEQRLFRRLGVFVGGFTLEAATAVLSSEFKVLSSEQPSSKLKTQNSELDVLDGLAALLDHSLLVVLEPVDGELRYGMLELLREYALERLREAGEEMEVRRRHAAFFAALVEHTRPSLSRDDLITSELLGRELGNFRAMLDWSLARPADEDALYALQLFGSMWELWFHNYRSEGGAIAERALACASARRQDLVAARIYNAAARLRKNPWRSTQGIELLQRSLALARQYADRPLQAEVLRHLGEATRADDLQAAESFFEESLRISRELNDAEQEGWTTFNLGQVARMRGDLADAERWYQHSLAIFVRLDDTFGQAFVLRCIALLAEQRGDNAAADGYLARALPLTDRLGLGVGLSPLIDRGQLACQRGDYQRALDLLRQGYDQVAQVDADGLGMDARMWQAVCHLELGDLVAATERCRQVLVSALKYVLGVRVSQIAMIVANIAVARGTHVAAARLLGCADSYLATTSYTFEHDMETDWKRLHDRALAACRAALDAEAFDAAWAAGQALTLEQAVAEALGDRE
jgi:predicted ATPase/transcriptional regulator with XRE-family HTH domain